jgi:hypothetical protein
MSAANRGLVLVLASWGVLLASDAGRSADLPVVCKINGAVRIADKLETYVQSGVGFVSSCKDNDCCIQTRYRQILLIERKRNASIWTRAVYFDELNRGIIGKNIGASVVDSSGREIGLASGEYELKNANVTTDSNGFGYLPVIVQFTQQAPTARIYLMRFSYSDRGAISYSYGPYFYIRDNGTPASGAFKSLSEEGFLPAEIK